MGTTELVVVADVDDIEVAETTLAKHGEQVVARRDQRGMVSAEWAVGIIAAMGIAGVLIAVVTNGRVQAALLSFILKLIAAFSGMMI